MASFLFLTLLLIGPINAFAQCIDPDLSTIRSGFEVQLCDGSTAVGTFAAPNDCTTTGEIGCLTTESHKSFDKNLAIPDNLREGINLDGVVGRVNAFKVSTPTLLTRTMGAAILSISSELAIPLSDALPGGYTEVPVPDTHGWGNPGQNENNAIERNSYSEWEAGVPRKVCGKSATTIEGKITNCDDEHAASRPNWDAAVTDGKISWSGQQSGVGPGGDWTLITVYHPSLADGVDCDGATEPNCREVWRDDRTGLIWSDRLGGHASPGVLYRNQFYHCAINGHTSNFATADCTPNVEASANEWTDGGTYSGVSLCLEVAGMLTPKGTGATTDTGGIDQWDDTGTEIIDSKGNMDLSTTPQVRWKVPTYQELTQALVLSNGFLVLQLSAAATYFSSTTRVEFANFALESSGSNSTHANRETSEREAICVGRP